MNRNDRSTIVLALIALLTVLATTAPVSAMNDPVTGRWITRDPLHYNRNVIEQAAHRDRGGGASPSVAWTSTRRLDRVADSQPDMTKKDRAMRPNSIGVAVSKNTITPNRLYEFLAANPQYWHDPTGLASCSQICSKIDDCCKASGMIDEVCKGTDPVSYDSCMSAGGIVVCTGEYMCSGCTGTCWSCWTFTRKPCKTNPPNGPFGWLGTRGTPSSNGSGVKKCVGDGFPDNYCVCPPGYY